ncbi:DMT family transporter [Priestia taiwanensis]|uniref:QacE family quaternary ammonium compound efflux SMR transporter n=1 Tax=Priestia taiwanensis TaxID=1347902 RepID=A0A917ASS5_9BACI|nr:multidrug efflux SMR transporter [Priestia taiwanensis]MBM7363923.1 paired small multidrug resistance pump [Priestia taiwanensis]GGE70151.1 QacE family quaternary ammonium compound efflux SMR transporter [Priestia taiwanensis]
MAWVFLILAGCLEIIGVMLMKRYSDTKEKWTIIGLIISFSFSFTCLSQAMKGIDMGTAYAVWTGIGTAGSALVGMVFFKESAEWKRIMFLSFILIGAVGLKLVGA